MTAEWAPIDDGGQPITDLNVTFRRIADTELIPNRFYAAVNVLYNPDYAQSPGEPWERSSQYGITGGLAYRVALKITLGGEAEYYRAYDAFGSSRFRGKLSTLDQPCIFSSMATRYVRSARLIKRWLDSARRMNTGR
jgi:hypothetical protein